MEKKKPLFIYCSHRIYISGALTDLATGEVSVENRAAFDKAEELLRSYGCRHVVNPTRVWMCRYPKLYNALTRITSPEWAYRITLLYDHWLLSRCTLIYKIPGWRQSKGANIESCWAYHCKIPLLSYAVREAIDKRLAVWMNKHFGNKPHPTQNHDQPDTPTQPLPRHQ